ncbi:MAG: hypothetical protein K6A42_10060 [Treponema sp.]|nr:hypothetical protein [Treponema sp.]
MLKKNNKYLASLCLSFCAFLLAACSYSGQTVINVNGYTLTTPPSRLYVQNNKEIPVLSSGMNGIDLAAEKVFLSKSEKSAIVISSAMVTVGQPGEDLVYSYMEALKKQLEEVGDVELNPRDGNNGLKICSMVVNTGDILTDKVFVYSLDSPNALMIDFVFDKEEFESLSGAMSDLLDSISFAE